MVRQLLRRSILWMGVLGLALPASPVFGQQGAQNGEWRSYGGDAGSTKYSSLDVIDETNVQDLEVVWRWQTVDYERQAEDPDVRFNSLLLATPLKVGDALFTSTNLGQAAAIDAVTGETLWVYNSVAEGTSAGRGRGTRGLAYWTDGSDERLLTVSGEHLVALGTRTGELYPEFGENGKVDLRQDMGPRLQRYSWNAAPLVCGDVVVVGAAMSDSPTRQEATPGYVRGYDVITGELRWRFNPVPQPGEAGNETWEDGSWQYSGNANVWSLMSGDDELGFAYLPIGTATNDYYGGHRHGDNLFSDSLVAVDLETGEYFHFVSNEEPTVGHLDGLLASQDRLYVADISSHGGFGSGARNSGAIYQIRYVGKPTVVHRVSAENPDRFSLMNAFPNPFNHETNLTLSLPVGADVTVDIYDVVGQRLRRIELPARASGLHVLSWDGRDDSGRPAGSGVYVFVVRWGSPTAPITATRKGLLLR